ncbi:hypothetical protein RY831_18530 [Noviherbaspirillum sp. CPCC 100848]|uniref:Uncharacterized protein n=1 Tax=Noviherbaspirillum album TaxID=3080276 RepID=A0ABU6JCX0_9BURK|nr:hypothetical protein [Noviherbaspirillum sp. CPCC 100848]MEC4721165.1 hypothetical protein [Noviherbaspirillum sp. CPCC 100848]
MANLKKQRRVRTRATLREQLGLGPRTGKPASPEATLSSAPQPHQDTLPIILSISDKNKHAIATQAIQRAIGTRPGLANEIQQRGWVGLLDHTLKAYDAVVEARENGQPNDVVHTLEQDMRYSLRELLYLSNATDVFNFGPYAPPQLDQDLDIFVGLPQFRTLVETVNDVHQRLERERLELGGRVEFAASSGYTDADAGKASGSRSP